MQCNIGAHDKAIGIEQIFVILLGCYTQTLDCAEGERGRKNTPADEDTIFIGL